jgi:DNA-binding HxlR family transcriptional regulator
MSAEARDRHDPAMCRAREILDLVADKWSLYVVSYLGHGSRRFGHDPTLVYGLAAAAVGG